MGRPGTTRRRAPTYGDAQLQTLQRNTFRYFWQETNSSNGLIPDNTSAGGIPASISGVGMALSSYPVAVERSFLARAQAIERTLATLRFFWNAPQSPTPDATGHRGAWGITASNGPGPATRRVRGVTRRFLGYVARGVPYGPDDGTLAPWAVVASLPFAPEIVLPTLQHCSVEYPNMESEYGLVCSFNPTFPSDGSGTSGWISHNHFALDQGPVILMIENYRSGLIWRLMRSCPHVAAGLHRAGFRGSWLKGSK